MLSPFCKMYGYHFDPNPEPQSWDKNFKKLFDNYFKGTKHRIYPLNYFFDKNEKTKNEIRFMDNALKFISDDHYTQTGEILFDINKLKIKRIGIKKTDSEDISVNKLREEMKKTQKKKRGRKKKKKNVHIVKIKKIK